MASRERPRMPSIQKHVQTVFRNWSTVKCIICSATTGSSSQSANLVLDRPYMPWYMAWYIVYSTCRMLWSTVRDISIACRTDVTQDTLHPCNCYILMWVCTTGDPVVQTSPCRHLREDAASECRTTLCIGEALIFMSYGLGLVQRQ